MNRLSVLLFVPALIIPVLAQGTVAPLMKPETNKVVIQKVVTKKPLTKKRVAKRIRKGKKPPVLSSVSMRHKLDFPWQMPS